MWLALSLDMRNEPQSCVVGEINIIHWERIDAYSLVELSHATAGAP